MKVDRRRGRVGRLPPQDAARIIDLYLAGASASRVAELVGYEKTTCLKALRRAGVAARVPGEYPPCLVADVVAFYQQGLSPRVVGLRTGLSPDRVQAILRRSAIPFRGRSAAGRLRPNARHSVDVGYFRSVDCEEKAYWLGFLSADGCVHGGDLSIVLNDQDLAHLLAFRSAIGSSHSVGSYSYSTPAGESHTAVRLTISCAAMCEDLARLGVVPRKSLILQAWAGPAGLMRHYFRGLVDGDGSVFQDGQGYWSVGLTGTRSVVEAFCVFLNTRIGSSISPHKANSRGTLHSTHTRGTLMPQAAARLLYHEASVALPRKRAAATILMSGDFARRALPPLRWGHASRPAPESGV